MPGAWDNGWLDAQALYVLEYRVYRATSRGHLLVAVKWDRDWTHWNPSAQGRLLHPTTSGPPSGAPYNV